MTKVASKAISAQEFLNMQGEENYIYELINGKIVKRSAPNPIHQIVSGKLFSLLNNYVLKNKRGVILYAPVDVFY